jgi:hypothetical protein
MAEASEPKDPGAREAGRPSALDSEALARLQERLDRASEAAERLIAEAAAQAAAQAAAAAARKPPPSGWQRPQPEAGTDSSPGEIELLLETIHALRDRIPPELQRRLGEALREVLLALRALIDWYLERTERRHSEPVQAHDIPIV